LLVVWLPRGNPFLEYARGAALRGHNDRKEETMGDKGGKKDKEKEQAAAVEETGSAG